MANPFPELLALLDSWTNTPGSVAAVRAEDGDSSRIDWAAQLEAARLLREAEAFTRAFEDWPTYEQVFRNAAWLLFQPQAQWRSHAAQDTGLFPEIRRVFGLLSKMYEYESHTAPTPLRREALDALRIALEDLRTGICVFPDHLKQDRERLLGIVDRCFELLDGDAVNGEDLRGLVHEVVSESLPLVGELPEEARKGFFGALLRASSAVSRSVLGPMAVGIATNRADAILMQALTGAS